MRDFNETKEASWEIARKFLAFELRILLRGQPSIYSRLEALPYETLPMGYYKISWTIFENLGDWHFIKTVNAEGLTYFSRIEREW